MSEYVYGPDQSVQINLFATQMYGNVETLLMYHTHKPLKKVLKGAEENAWNKRIKEIWKKFQRVQRRNSLHSRYSLEVLKCSDQIYMKKHINQ